MTGGVGNVVALRALHKCLGGRLKRDPVYLDGFVQHVSNGRNAHVVLDTCMLKREVGKLLYSDYYGAAEVINKL